VIVENGELLSYYDHPSLPRSVKFREDDKFVLLDARVRAIYRRRGELNDEHCRDGS
jgi:hypothetical protein